MDLIEIERVRTIYKKYVEVYPDDPKPWIKWGELEKSLEENERYRCIFELAIKNPNLDQPQIVWKAYISNEMELKEYDNCRDLYERLLKQTQHLKVWLSYAEFENSIGEKEKSRILFERAEKYFKDKGTDFNEVNNFFIKFIFYFFILEVNIDILNYYL